jgi:hypothetical protein
VDRRNGVVRRLAQPGDVWGWPQIRAQVPPRRIWIVPTLLGAVTGMALVVDAAHWVTDVLGGGLLATAILAGVAATGLAGRPPAARRRGSDPEPRGADAGDRASHRPR